MIGEPKKYKVSILGESYSLVSDETEQHIMGVASEVDACLSEMLKKSSSLDGKKCAILIAVQYASLLAKAREQIEQYQAERKHFTRLLDQSLCQIEQTK